jgi:hypothetical protein
MKKLQKLILLISLTFLSNSFFSQTTLEEYNYITKGYKVQIESGLDMKKGYLFEDVYSQKSGERLAELKVLYRIKETKKEIAAYLIIYSKEGNEPEYLCVPNPKSEKEIILKYWNQLNDGKGDYTLRLQLIVYLTSINLKW